MKEKPNKWTEHVDLKRRAIPVYIYRPPPYRGHNGGRRGTGGDIKWNDSK